MVNFDNTFLAKLYNVKPNRFLTLEETAFQKAMRPISEMLKTITGAFPLSWSDGAQKPLDKCKITPYLAQNGITVGGKLYKVADGVTLLDSATAAGIGFVLDFGIKPKLTSKARIVFTPIASNNSGFGGARKDTDNVRFSVTTFSSGEQFTFAMTKTTWSNNKTNLVVGQRYDCVAFNGKQIINGTEHNETVLTDLTATDTTFKICAIDGNGGAASSTPLNAKYEVFYIWEGDTPVLLAHPAIKNNVVGFYDLVTGTFITPSVGTLTAGKTTKTVNAHSEIPVDEYQEVSYVAIPSGGYIASGAHANPAKTNSRLKVNMTNVSGTSALFGARGTTSSSTRSYNIFGAVSSGNGRFDNVNPSQNFVFSANTLYDIALGHNGLKGTVQVNGGETSEGVQGMSDEDVGEIYIGTLNNVGTPFVGGTPAQWAYVEIATDGTTIDRKMYPVKRLSDNAFGMYDLVSGTFFGNAGTGDFTGGSAYQLEVPICSVEHSGDKTENLFDSADMTIGEVINADGSTASSTMTNHSNYIAVEPNTTYTVKDRSLFSIGTNQITRYHAYGSDKSWLSQITSKTVNTTNEDFTVTFTTPSNCYFVRFTTRQPLNNAVIMLVKGSTAPSAYVPFGYKYKTIIGSQGYLDLGNAAWNYSSTSICFWREVPSKAFGVYNQFIPNLTLGTVYNQLLNGQYCGHEAYSRIYIRADEFNGNAAAFKSAMSGKLLFYQRTTDATYEAPQVIDTVTDMLQGSVDLVSGVESEEWLHEAIDDSSTFGKNAGINGLFHHSVAGGKIHGSTPYDIGFCNIFTMVNKQAGIIKDWECTMHGNTGTNSRISFKCPAGMFSTVDEFKQFAIAAGLEFWTDKGTPTAKQGTANVIQGYAGTMTVDCKASGQGEIRYYANGVSGGNATNLEVD